MRFNNPLVDVSDLTSGDLTANITVVAGGWLRSDNFVAGVSGWDINDAAAEFNTVVVRGTVIVGVGSDVPVTYLSSGTVETTTITLKTWAAVIRSDNYNPGVDGFRIRGSGDAEFNNVAVRGTVVVGVGSDVPATYLTAGTIGTETIILSGLGSTIKSSNYNPGVAGWVIDGSGVAEFANVIIRGTVYASAGELGSLSVTGTLTLAGTGGLVTAAAGDRIELASAAPNTLNLYTDNAAETWPAYFAVVDQGVGLGTYVEIRSSIEGVLASYLRFGSESSADAGITLESYLGDVIVNAGAGGPSPATLRLQGALIRLEAPAAFSDGSAAAPGLYPSSDPDSGFYYAAANTLGLALGGTRRYQFSTTAFYIGPDNTGNTSIRLGGSAGAPATALSFVDFHTGGPVRAARIIVDGGTGVAYKGNYKVQSAEFRATGVYSTTGAGDATVGVTSSGLLRRQTSARKYKKRERPAPELADIVLTPVSYRDRKTGHQHPAEYVERSHYSFIADDLAAQNPLLGIYGPDGIEDYDQRAILAVLAAKVARLEDLLLQSAG